MQEPAAFAEIVAPLEVRTGRRLNGPGRLQCLRAFKENEYGFGACATDALRRGRENPLGLLVKMVRDRDWNVPPPEGAPSPVNESGCTHEGCRGLAHCRYA
jgi:hypothetical protein